MVAYLGCRKGGGHAGAGWDLEIDPVDGEKRREMGKKILF
jgi:hypothetical protein